MMKKKKLFALLMAIVMLIGLTACGNKDSGEDVSGGEEGSGLNLGYDSATGETFYGPYYDEWSEKSDEELYEMAKEEVSNGAKKIVVYATSSKMTKVKDDFIEAYPELELEVIDLDSDEVLSKAEIENDSGNINADVLQSKDVNGEVFFEHYEKGVLEPYYPKDICSHIDEANLKYSFPLYASQAFWYYNTEAFPDGQPITSWWQIIEKNPDGSQKYRLFTKEIGQETAYLSLFASFINHADEMEANYKELYGEDLEYTYDPSGFEFEVPENNAGVEYLWRFTQLQEMTFIGDGDELVHAADDPALALASAGKIGNRDESGYNIAWCIGLKPYTALLNTESLFVVNGCDNPAGARLFIRFVTGGADGQSGGFKPFAKEGNWPLRDDIEDEKNPAKLPELGAIANELDTIYDIYPDVRDMWLKWRDV